MNTLASVQGHPNRDGIFQDNRLGNYVLPIHLNVEREILPWHPCREERLECSGAKHRREVWLEDFGTRLVFRE